MATYSLLDSFRNVTMDLNLPIGSPTILKTEYDMCKLNLLSCFKFT